VKEYTAPLASRSDQTELLPTPAEALRGVRVNSIAAAGYRSYAVADTGELWAWGFEILCLSALGHGEQNRRPLPKPVEALRGVKVDAVAACGHTLGLTDDGSVYAWGSVFAGETGALGLGPSVNGAGVPVHTPRRIPGLRLACGL
jgi:alpha-tubulin suppressor-like RCC1 family protein